MLAKDHPSRYPPRDLGLQNAALEEVLHLGDDGIEDIVIRHKDNAVEARHDS